MTARSALFRTVFTGSFSEALVLQSALAAEGLETLLRDEIVNTLDPFLTGPEGLMGRLEARAADADAIPGVIHDLRRDLDSSVEDDQEAAQLKAERVRSRVHWAILSPLVILTGG